MAAAPTRSTAAQATTASPATTATTRWPAARGPTCSSAGRAPTSPRTRAAPSPRSSRSDGRPNDGSADDGPAGARDTISSDVENLTGGDAGDSLTGDGGRNVLRGGPGSDGLDGRNGDDTELGGDGDDSFFADWDVNGADVLDGEGGDHDLAHYISRPHDVTLTLDGQANDGAAGEGDRLLGMEDLHGGSGSDHLVGDDRPNLLVGYTAGDSLVGLGGDDRLVGLDGADGLFAGDGDDVVDGGYGGDALNGEGGDDTFPATSCAVLCGDYTDVYDLVDGGPGTDSVEYTWRVVGVKVALDGTWDSGEDQDGNGDSEENDRFLAVERVVGSQVADRLIGSPASDELVGGPGDDTLDGRAGPDVLRGEDGNDTFVTGEQQDGADGMWGGAGTDVASYAPRLADLVVTLDDGSSDGAPLEDDNVHADVEGIVGGLGYDYLSGNGEPNVLWGGGGRDTLLGLAGPDELHGGDEIDSLFAGDGGDRLFGDAGNDFLNGEDGSDEVRGGAGQDRMDGGTGDDQLLGEAGDDSFTEGGTANGADLISCGTGGETPGDHPWYDTVQYFGTGHGDGRPVAIAVSLDNRANDGQDADGDGWGEEGDNVQSDCEEVWGGRGNDLFEGNAAANSFIGLDGNDTFRTRGGADRVDGREGDDTFYARDGEKQTLFGGNGTDWAQYDAGVDVLAEFP